MADDTSARGTYAVESAQLRRDLDEAREQFAATNEVLTALGRSATDSDAVLGTVVDSARRVCRADAAKIHLVDGGAYRLARSSGLTEVVVDYITTHPIAADRRTMIGRVGLDRRPHQIADVLSDPGYGRPDLQRIAGFRSTMGAPMLLDGDVVGVLAVWRNDVDPFDEREASLLTTFAAQAAIAIRSVELVRALEARSTELAHTVDQFEALGAVGEAVNSSLDLDEVLSTIVTHAVQLSGTDGGSIMEFDESAQAFRVRTAYGTSRELLERLRRTPMALSETLVGRSATEGRPCGVPELHGKALDPHLQCLYDAGWRSVLAVPMLREGRIVGALVVRRRTPGRFSAEVADLLEAFASQSALAILNARLYGELEQKSRELEVASQHKSEFLASMSHELRTPLNAVIGFSEVLLERMFGEINDRQEEYLRDIWNSGRHLLDLINDILDLSKVEAGLMELERSTFSVGRVIDYALSMVRERAARHAITVVSDVAPDVGLVDADERRFKQVVVNLLTNAVKFTPVGGTVTVRAVTRGPELAVTVEDTGIGVPPEHRDRIFEAFQQVGRTSRQQEGTGLGLALSRRIVELHGGRMWLESTVGIGSTFGFTVPVGSPIEPPGLSAGNRPTAGLSVVVIEDDRKSLDLLTVYLGSADVNVVGRSTGREGLSAVRRLDPAAVVLDIRLPDMDGWDLLTALKADSATAHIPVVVVSIVDERAKGLALGATEYLVKPVNRDVVLSAVARIIALPESSTRQPAKETEPS